MPLRLFTGCPLPPPPPSGSLKWQYFQILPLPSIWSKACSFIGHHRSVGVFCRCTYMHARLSQTNTLGNIRYQGKSSTVCSTLTRCSTSFSQSCVWKQSQSSVVHAVSSLYTPGRLIILCFSSQFHLCGDTRRDKQTRCAPETSVEDERRQRGKNKPESVWVVLCFTSPSFVNRGSPERGVAQRGHSNSRDSVIISRENLWKPILLDRSHRGFLLCFLCFYFEDVYRWLGKGNRSEDKKHK